MTQKPDMFYSPSGHVLGFSEKVESELENAVRIGHPALILQPFHVGAMQKQGGYVLTSSLSGCG